MAQKKTKRLPLILSAALLTTALTVPAASAEEPDYILNISDTKVFDHTSGATTQTGSVNLYYYGGPGSSISSEGQDMESDKPIKVNQTIMSDWKSAFWTEGKNFATDKNTVFDITFKVYLDDYSQPSPYVGLRLFTSNNYVNCEGMEWRGIQLQESEKDTLHHMRYVLSKGEDGKAVVLYSLDGAAYKTSTGGAVPDEAGNWGYTADGDYAQLRFMPTSIPSIGRMTGSTMNTLNDGEDVLDTPVNWEFYSFTAYQTNEVPDPPVQEEPEEISYIVDLSDKKYISGNTVKQDGSADVPFYVNTGVGTISSDYADEPSGAPIKIRQVLASDYQLWFTIPTASFKNNKNTVIDVKFKVSLEDYSYGWPQIGLSLSHQNGTNGFINQSFGMGWRGAALNEADKDKVHTVRFVVSPEGNATNAGCMRIYYSYDGAEYSINDNSNIAVDPAGSYDGELRLWVEALLERNAFTDGKDALPTAVNWEIYSMTAYQTSSLPSASSIDTTIPEQPEPPEESITVTERYNANTVADGEFAGYFWNVTVPTLEGRDAIKGTFTSEKEQKTMEREFDITMINGGGGAVFSVLLLDAPDDVTAKFE